MPERIRPFLLILSQQILLQNSEEFGDLPPFSVDKEPRVQEFSEQDEESWQVIGEAGADEQIRK